MARGFRRWLLIEACQPKPTLSKARPPLRVNKWCLSLSLPVLHACLPKLFIPPPAPVNPIVSLFNKPNQVFSKGEVWFRGVVWLPQLYSALYKCRTGIKDAALQAVDTSVLIIQVARTLRSCTTPQAWILDFCAYSIVSSGVLCNMPYI